MSSAALGRDLGRLVGGATVLTDRASRIAAGTDFVTQRGVPAAVVRPTETDQIAPVLSFANQRGISVVSRGAATNLSAAMLPNAESVVLDLSQLNRILDIDVQARCATVEPGVINADLKAAALGVGLRYAPDPASAPISTIGGNIAENAGGPGCIKHGVTFHHVRGVDMVLPEGRSLTLTDQDDIDLLGVAIGSEGILGVLTRATVNLIPIVAEHWTALLSFDRMHDAAHAVSEIIAAGVVPAALEFSDRRFMEITESYLPSGYPTTSEAMLIVELDGDADEVADQVPALSKVLQRWDPGLRVAKDTQDRHALWAGRLAAGQAIHATGFSSFICDSAVPRERVPEMVEQCREIATAHNLDIPMIGHAGDGNVHPVILYRPDQLDTVEVAAREITDCALTLGGSLTGEHGVGTAKLGHMSQAFTPAELAAFRAVKRAFDPTGLLNPGVLLPDPGPDEPDLPEFSAAVTRALTGGGASRHNTATPPPEPCSNTTIDIDVENMSLTAGAQARCRDVHAAAKAANLDCPMMDTGDDRTVAELVAAEGNRQPTRRALLGVKAQLTEGHSVSFGSSAMKDVAGLDLKRLMAGGHGHFGELKSVTVRTVPQTR